MSLFLKPVMLAEISRDVGLVFFASLFVGPITTDSWQFSIIFSGLTLSLIFWITSLFLAKE
jgi:hypothetical protein